MDRHYLLYFETRPEEAVPEEWLDLARMAKEKAQATDVLLAEVEDLSLIQGEPCLGIRVQGLQERIEAFLEGLGEKGIRVVDADNEIRAHPEESEDDHDGS